MRSVGDWYSVVRATEYANSAKGIPIPRSGLYRKRWSPHATRNSGVMGNSRILAHRYMDELDNGRWHRREIRRKERAAWMAEAIAEMEEEFSSLMDEPDF